MCTSEASWVSHAPQKPFHRQNNEPVFQSPSDWPSERLRCENVRAQDNTRGTSRLFWRCSNILLKISRVPLLFRREKLRRRNICEFVRSWLVYRVWTLPKHAKVLNLKRRIWLYHLHLSWFNAPFCVAGKTAPGIPKLKALYQTPNGIGKFSIASWAQH